MASTVWSGVRRAMLAPITYRTLLRVSWASVMMAVKSPRRLPRPPPSNRARGAVRAAFARPAPGHAGYPCHSAFPDAQRTPSSRNADHVAARFLDFQARAPV